MFWRNIFQNCRIFLPKTTVKPVLVATSIKNATCIKQTCNQFPEKENALKCTCIKQTPVLNKCSLIIPKVLATGWTVIANANAFPPNFRIWGCIEVDIFTEKSLFDEKIQ